MGVQVPLSAPFLFFNQLAAPGTVPGIFTAGNFGLYLLAHDDNNLPVDAPGALIPLPLSSTSPMPAGFI